MEQFLIVGLHLDGLDEHGVSGVLVRVELFAVPHEEDGLCPQDEDHVVGVGSTPGALGSSSRAEELVRRVDL